VATACSASTIAGSTIVFSRFTTMAGRSEIEAALAGLVMRFRFLGLQVASFTAIDAVVETVVAEADVVQALAQSAVAVALTLLFRLVTDPADESVCHGRNSSARCASWKGVSQDFAGTSIG